MPGAGANRASAGAVGARAGANGPRSNANGPGQTQKAQTDSVPELARNRVEKCQKQPQNQNAAKVSNRGYCPLIGKSPGFYPKLPRFEGFAFPQ